MPLPSPSLLCWAKPLQWGCAQEQGVGTLMPPSSMSIPVHLISRSHQQSPKSLDGSCNDSIHSVIQGEAQQEEETSIQKEAQDTAH